MVSVIDIIHQQYFNIDNNVTDFDHESTYTQFTIRTGISMRFNIHINVRYFCHASLYHVCKETKTKRFFYRKRRDKKAVSRHIRVPFHYLYSM